MKTLIVFHKDNDALPQENVICDYENVKNEVIKRGNLNFEIYEIKKMNYTLNFEILFEKSDSESQPVQLIHDDVQEARIIKKVTENFQIPE